MKRPNPRKTLESLGYTIVYKPHEKVARHMAFYRVEYQGKEIKCPVADVYGVPLNQIWLTEKFKPFERYVLYHEFNEIKYLAEGLEPWEAHLIALEDDKVWEGEEKWREFRKEINIIPQEELTKIHGFGPVMFKKIMEGRPYFSMDEVREVEGVGEKRYRRLVERCWCF